MPGMNKVILLGRLGADPESRVTSSGKTVAKLRLATDSGFGDKKQTEWHSIVCFDKTAENAAKFLSKGSLVLVEGRLRYAKWEKDDGQVVTFAEIVANEVQFLDPPGRSSTPPKPAKATAANGPGDVGDYSYDGTEPF